MASSHLSPDQQFLLAHATRSYYGNTQLLDVAGEPMWIVNEGEYCMMNTLDLSIDQAFWELDQNPWVVRNVLDPFVRNYSYVDEVKLDPRDTARRASGGVSFAHDMGAHNNFSPRGTSSYELAHLKGCFSYMTQEQLCNWILLAACYVAKTNDVDWLQSNAHVLDACAASMRARANPRSGIMAHDSARCDDGWEITTYDSLDASLGQARANTYLAVKCWATWVGLEMLACLCGRLIDSLANKVADYLLLTAVEDAVIPAVLEKESAGFQSRILPAVEGLVYVAYWSSVASGPEWTGVVNQALRHPLMGALRRHTIALVTDPQRRNVFIDGGIKLSSTSNNSWMSKIFLFQFVCRHMLRLDETHPAIEELFDAADAAHVRWQTEGSAFWACSDQFVNGVAKGSRYYPRLVTAWLWMMQDETARVEVAVHAQSHPQKSAAKTTPQ